MVKLRKTNREKAIIVALISWFIPGLSRFYLGDTTSGILAVLFTWLGVGMIFTVLDLMRFTRMSDASFDQKYTVGFKMSSVNLTVLFGALAVPLTVIGLVCLGLKDHVACFNYTSEYCVLVTPGKDVLAGEGQRISGFMGWAVQNLAPYTLGLAGILFLGAVFKSNKVNT
jgi:TM2 domain-containing membrane protein YozV